MREYRLINEAIRSFGLDLRGRCVFTEAASNAYLWTPLLAAAAGADRVFAIARDSCYGKAGDIERITLKHAVEMGVGDRIHIVPKKSEENMAHADIITNLGFVRPIDDCTVSWIRREAVIPLMWEPWEFRSEDIDLAACQRKGIVILGTNERDPRLCTFEYVGLVVTKLMLEHSLEVRGCRVLLLGSGPFVDATAKALERLDAIVTTAVVPLEDETLDVDAIVCLEHRDRNLCLIGVEGILNQRTSLRGTELIIHICGRIDRGFIDKRGWRCIPTDPAPAGRMSFTTAYVGPQPVINLHAAGLKVSQAYLDGDRDTLRELAMPLQIAERMKS